MIRGSCLCGGVQFQVDGRALEMSSCYCSRCRKAYGSAAGTIVVVNRGDFRYLRGEDLVAPFQSSARVNRPFCSNCVNMSSLGGLLAVPYMSAYTSAKFALEALSEALYHEMKLHKIDVVIMQPVAMHMERPATGAHLETVKNVAPNSFSHKMVARMAKDTAASKLTPEMVAEKIYSVITSDKKPLRVPMDRAKAVTLIKRLAPQFFIDKMMGGLMRAAEP